MCKRVIIFPLPKLSLQPGARKPLNIFEPRYLKMVKDAEKLNIPIALAYGLTEDDVEANEETLEIPHESLPKIRKVVCIAKPEIVQECEDGSMVILLTGESRAKLLNPIASDQPYIVCEYEDYQGNDEIKAENILLLRRLKTQLEKWVLKKVKLECQKNILKSCISQPSRVVGLYIELIIDSQEVKQDLLEMSDINEKIQYIIFNC